MTNKQIVERMLIQGGSFVNRLAHAWLAADPMNRARIEQAFADLFERYRKQVA